MAGGDRDSRRRSLRLMKKKEAGASEESQMLCLKEEAKVLRNRQQERWALEDRRRAEKALPAGAGKDDRTPPPAEAQPAEAGRKKRKKVVKKTVPQRLIEYMILNPHNPFPNFREETLGKRSQKFREFYFEEKAIADNFLEYEQALIKQFRTKGYAVDYSEVTDYDDED